MNKQACTLFGSLLLAAFAAHADGLNSAPINEDAPTMHWQGRLSLGTQSSAWLLGVEPASTKLVSASLMGDYYFSRSLLGADQSGGLRATSGLIMGGRSWLTPGASSLAVSDAWGVDSHPLGARVQPGPGDSSWDSATLPYVGVGYTGLSVRNGWAFSADLGLIAQTPGSARLGRVFYGGQTLDDAVHDMRLAPLVQFAVSYSF